MFSLLLKWDSSLFMHNDCSGIMPVEIFNTELLATILPQKQYKYKYCLQYYES